MRAKNRTNRVTKTVTVGNVKLQTPADRIGTGFVAGVASLPAEFLSPGQFPLSQLPAREPEPGSRPQEVSAMRYQPHAAITVLGSAGRASGPVVRRTPLALMADGANRPAHSWSHCPRTRPGSDCQSPDRVTDTTDRKRRSRPTPTPATRMSRPLAATAK